MEMAKVTSKGQITIPISIRRRLGINEGDKILFVNKQDGVMMLNPDTVQGDIADYAADSIPLETKVAAKPASAPASKTSSKTPVPAPSPAPAAVAADEPVEQKPAAEIAADSPVTAPIEPPKRKYIPPVEDPEPKPAQPGGINLNTLLDDIRSIGSNI